MAVKMCPFCAEEILADAIKCKHCGSMLTGTTPVHLGDEAPRKALPFAPVPGDTPTSGGLFFLLVVALVVILSFIVGPAGPTIMVLVVLGTSVWVFFDAEKHRLAQYETVLSGPVGACLGSLLFWIIVFPWYLAIRSRIRAGVQPVKVLAPVQDKSKGKLTFVGYLGVGLGLLVILLYVPVIVLGPDDQGYEMFLRPLAGVGIALASYLWVRR